MTTQHRVLVMDVQVARRVERKGQETTSRIKWWHLKGEKQRNFQRRILDEVRWKAQGSANELWDEMTKGNKKVAKRCSRNQGLKGKESLRWYARKCFKARS